MYYFGLFRHLHRLQYKMFDYLVIEEESERTQSSISEHLKASLAIPTYEQHACRKKADIMTVVYSCTWLQVQRSSRFSTVGDQKTTKTTAMGRSLNTKSKDFLGGDTQTSELLKLGVQNSSSQSMVEAIAAITDDAHDEKIESMAA